MNVAIQYKWVILQGLVGLWGTDRVRPMCFSILLTMFFLIWTWEAMRKRELKDTKGALAGIQVCTGRDWSAKTALEVAESRLRQRALVGSIARMALDPFLEPGSRTLKAKNGNILCTRRREQARRKHEPAGQWGWESKEHGLNGRKHHNNRSPDPTSGKWSSTTWRF